jgi:sugar (pentulose or hexulose) kinase
MPATHKGTLLPEIADDIGIGRVPIVNVASHDTTSALTMALLCDKNSAYLSSGTWSIMGLHTGKPIINETVLEYGFTNEATIKGDFRIAKNLIGLWIVQECKRYWAKTGIEIDWEAITILASSTPSMGSLIDPNDQLFFEAGNMPNKIQLYCKQTKQRIPKSIGEIAGVVFESLALCYRWVFEDLEEIKGSRIEALHIVGGGSQNQLLNQFTANAINRPVYCGPTESTAIGNIVAQMHANGDISSYADAECILQKSFEIGLCEPKEKDCWDEKYSKYLKLIENEERDFS